MRRVYAGRVVYVIAVLLLAAALFFAWFQSQEIVIVPEEEVTGIHGGEVDSVTAPGVVRSAGRPN